MKPLHGRFMKKQTDFVWQSFGQNVVESSRPGAEPADGQTGKPWKKREIKHSGRASLHSLLDRLGWFWEEVPSIGLHERSIMNLCKMKPISPGRFCHAFTSLKST